jgi:hypothetical protein
MAKDKAAGAFQPDAHTLNKQIRAERKKHMGASIIANRIADDLRIAEEGRRVSDSSTSYVDSDIDEANDSSEYHAESDIGEAPTIPARHLRRAHSRSSHKK